MQTIEEKRAYCKAYYWANRDKLLAYARRVYHEDVELSRLYQRVCGKALRDKRSMENGLSYDDVTKVMRHKTYIKNKEKYREKTNERNRKWKSSHKEHIKLYTREYRRKLKEAHDAFK